MVENLLTCKQEAENEANEICQTERPRKRNKIDPKPRQIPKTEDTWLNKENFCPTDNMLMKLTKHFHEYLKSNENKVRTILRNLFSSSLYKGLNM